jgi:hypothetical protein
MTALDEALEKYLADDEYQSEYYDLVLNSDFYIPLADEDEASSLGEKESVTPLVVESEGKSYMMLFDTEEKLAAWAKKPVNYVVLAGFMAAEISVPELLWAVNIGGGFAKEFVPEEIRWLQESVSAS